MARVALKPSLTLARFLRKKREEMGLTLRDVERRTAEAGSPIPFTTLGRVEQGKFDPGVRRLHQLLRLYHVPPHLAADLVELEERSVEVPTTGDLETLLREGVEAWKRGDIPKGLAYLFAVRERVPEDDASRMLLHDATLTMAVFARELGKYALARQILDEVLCTSPERTILVRALILSSSIWRGLGSLDVAIALVNHAATLLLPDDAKLEAWVLHQKARLLVETGRPAEAEEALSRTIALSHGLGDTHSEAGALVLLVRALRLQGKRDEALRCARELLAFSHRHDHALYALAAHLAIGRLLVAAGSVPEGIAEIHNALGQSVLLKDRNAEFACHYHLWKAHELSNDQERARFEREAAIYFVRFVDETSPEAGEVRKLIAPGGSHDPRRKSRRRVRH